MKHTSIIILLVLMLLSCGNKQRQGLYYGNYGYGYGDKATQDTLVEDQELPINDRKAKAPVDNSFSPVPMTRLFQANLAITMVSSTTRAICKVVISAMANKPHRAF